MSVSLSPLSDEDSGAASAGLPAVSTPPPPNFRPISGQIRGVQLSFDTYVPQKGTSAAKHQGLRYEAKVQLELQAMFPGYIPGPRLEFFDDAGWRRLVPDGLLRLPLHNVLFEIKLSHVRDAYWQLFELYAPVLRAMHKKPVQCIEIVRSYDPGVHCPRKPTIIENLPAWVNDQASVPKFGVCQWRL